VKLPGNASWFYNENGQLYRFDLFKTDFISRWFNLKLQPSPHPTFMQGRYLQVHMLRYCPLIYILYFITIALMVLVPILKACKKRDKA
jgi:hypothetical protein